MNHDEPTEPVRQRQALSALMDGDAAAAELALQGWRGDAGSRADWHAYHVIGEVMRSDDVRCAPGRDAAFLGRLRERLAREPVVIAPAPSTSAAGLASRTDRRAINAWMRPLAVAAGFAAVAGVLVVTRVGAPEGSVGDRSSMMAGQGPAPTAPAAASGAEGGLLRSAEIDRYLAAHRQYSSTSALAAPGGSVRNATATTPGR